MSLAWLSPSLAHFWLVKTSKSSSSNVFRFLRSCSVPCQKPSPVAAPEVALPATALIASAPRVVPPAARRLRLSMICPNH
jgi:hypothetical protein